MTEVAMYLAMAAAVLVILLVPLVYICVLRASDESHRRLIGLIQTMKRTAPRRRWHLPSGQQRKEEESDDSGE